MDASRHCTSITKEEYRELFGSDEEDGNLLSSSPAALAPSDSPPAGHDHRRPGGLQLIKDFLSPGEQSELASTLALRYPHLVNPVSGRSNQAMYFAPTRSDGLPEWMQQVGQRIQAQFMASHNQDTRLNQMILNSYAPGNGLIPHVDLHRFADGVAILSFQSTLVMDLYHPNALQHMPPEIHSKLSSFPAIEMHHLCSGGARSDPVHAIANADVPSFVRTLPADSLVHWVLPGLWARALLTPGSGLLLEGEARWEWLHGIREAQVEYWPLRSVGPTVRDDLVQWIAFPRELRSSVTVRTLVPDADDKPSDQFNDGSEQLE